MLVFIFLCSFEISTLVSALKAESRLDNGSSNKNIFGFLVIALPIATLCLWPPDSCLGFLSNNSSICKIFAACITFCSISSFGLFSIFNPNDIFS